MAEMDMLNRGCGVDARNRADAEYEIKGMRVRVRKFGKRLVARRGG